MFTRCSQVTSFVYIFALSKIKEHGSQKHKDNRRYISVCRDCTPARKNFIRLVPREMRATTRVFITIIRTFIPLVFRLYSIIPIELYHRCLYSFTIIITFRKCDIFYNPNNPKFIYDVTSHVVCPMLMLSVLFQAC